MCLNLVKNVNATKYYTITPGGNIFEYDKLYCTWNIENIHWTLLIVNFKGKSMKYLDGEKLYGTEYIGSVMHWLEFEDMRL